MSQSDNMKALGFQDPDIVRQSEYRAIHEVIDYFLYGYDPSEHAAVAISMIDEVIEIANAEKQRLQHVPDTTKETQTNEEPRSTPA